MGSPYRSSGSSAHRILVRPPWSAGRRRDARAALTDARDTFEALGESIWTERAKTELKRVGGRTRSGQSLTGANSRLPTSSQRGIPTPKSPTSYT